MKSVNPSSICTINSVAFSIISSSWWLLWCSFLTSLILCYLLISSSFSLSLWACRFWLQVLISGWAAGGWAGWAAERVFGLFSVCLPHPRSVLINLALGPQEADLCITGLPCPLPSSWLSQRDTPAESRGQEERLEYWSPLLSCPPSVILVLAEVVFSIYSQKSWRDTSPLKLQLFLVSGNCSIPPPSGLGKAMVLHWCWPLGASSSSDDSLGPVLTSWNSPFSSMSLINFLSVLSISWKHPDGDAGAVFLVAAPPYPLRVSLAVGLVGELMSAVRNNPQALVTQ